jgi:hypothetical protein
MIHGYLKELSKLLRGELLSIFTFRYGNQDVKVRKTFSLKYRV